ncbi:hypothetical protein BJX64DRAFT_269619 [Aspergillus heterothallicus]
MTGAWMDGWMDSCFSFPRLGKERSGVVRFGPGASHVRVGIYGMHDRNHVATDWPDNQVSFRAWEPVLLFPRLGLIWWAAIDWFGLFQFISAQSVIFSVLSLHRLDSVSRFVFGFDFLCLKQFEGFLLCNKNEMGLSFFFGCFAFYIYKYYP